MKHKVPVDQVSTYVRHLLSARRVADRYSVHIRTLSRWEKRKVIPPPDEVICNRRYWYNTSLDEADRKRTIEAGKVATTNTHLPERETASPQGRRRNVRQDKHQPPPPRGRKRDQDVFP